MPKKKFVYTVGVCALLHVFGGVARAQESLSHYSSHHQALYGELEFEQCSDMHAKLILKAWRVGKLASQDPDFATCIERSPYIPCAGDAIADTCVAICASASENSMSVRCASDLHGNALTPGSAIVEAFHDNTEIMVMNSRYLDEVANKTIDFWSARVAQTLWHEVMHNHAFRHGSGTIEEAAAFCEVDPNEWDPRVNSMPYIVGSCMRESANQLIDKRFAALTLPPPEPGIRRALYQAIGDGQIESVSALDCTIEKWAADNKKSEPLAHHAAACDVYMAVMPVHEQMMECEPLMGCQAQRSAAWLSPCVGLLLLWFRRLRKHYGSTLSRCR